MKKTIKIVACLLVAVTLVAFVFSGCDIKRKLNGAEMNFPSKVSNAKALSFDMVINYKKGDSTTVVNMSCYKATTEDGVEEYAYDYSSPDSKYLKYRNIYADGKKYEFIDTDYNVGFYHIEDDVNIDDDSNILYHITQHILVASVASLLVKAKKETINGEQTYRYDVEIEGKNISIWYNSDVLVQLYAKFDGQNGEETEEYTIALSNYKFEDEVSTAIFERSNNYVGYVDMILPAETWVEVINGFAKKLGA